MGLRARGRDVHRFDVSAGLLQLLTSDSRRAAVRSLASYGSFFAWYTIFMKIEMKRVTWYSQIIAIVVYVGTFYVAYQLGGYAHEDTVCEAPSVQS